MDALPPPLAPDYKNRRTGLIVFGILMILLGSFMALSVPISVIGFLIGGNKVGPQFTGSQVVASATQATLFAVVLIWLGVGSIKARRWARALILCGGWLALLMGVVSSAMLPLTLPAVRAALEQQPNFDQLPASVVAITMTAVAVTTVFFYVGIPVALILFYRSRHVKLTCEELDPVGRWTDRCPLPVLAVVLVFGGSALLILLAGLPQYGGAFLLFGSIVTGVPSYALWLITVGALVWMAVGLHRLDPRIWWVCVAFMAISTVNMAVSMSQVGILDYYRAAGMTESQLSFMKGMPLIRAVSAWWTMLPGFLFALGYFIYLRRYFVRPTAADA